MKSWADHCSSDEESLSDEINEQLASQKLDDEIVPTAQETAVDVTEPKQHEAETAPPPEKLYDYPTAAPFTAFVGNLAYSVEDGEQLMAGLADVAAKRLGEGQINVVSGRVATDRNGRHRGFGYIEVESLDQLKLLMTLNDGESMIADRKIQLDTANDRNHNNRRNNNNSKGGFFEKKRSPGEGFDGAQFRGGRFSNNNDSQPSGGGEDRPPAQRTSLKLAPRTKPREGGANSAPSSIFGGAKARDANSWEKKKLEDKKDSNQQRSSQNRPGRGGRGRGGDAGRGGRGEKANKKIIKRDTKPKETPEEKPPKAAKPAKPAAKVEPEPAAIAPAKKAAPTNKFALLMDSDSD